VIFYFNNLSLNEPNVFLKRWWSLQVKTKSFLISAIIWFLSLSGTVQAQQEKGQGDMAGTGQSPSEVQSYMGGKGHYLADSPYYMSGKRHYLQDQTIPGSKEIGQKEEPIPDLKGDKTSEERKESEEQQEPHIQIEINMVPREPAYGYGIIALPDIRPKHKGGAIGPPPNVKRTPPQTGKFTPHVPGGFRQGTVNFR
jgi:hypothetical protein